MGHGTHHRDRSRTGASTAGHGRRLCGSRQPSAVHNLEVIGLLRRLRPNFKTLADFRRENREAFRQVFRDFVKGCRSLELFGRELIAVDGTRIKAVKTSGTGTSPGPSCGAIWRRARNGWSGTCSRWMRWTRPTWPMRAPARGGPGSGTEDCGAARAPSASRNAP